MLENNGKPTKTLGVKLDLALAEVEPCQIMPNTSNIFQYHPVAHSNNIKHISNYFCLFAIAVFELSPTASEAVAMGLLGCTRMPAAVVLIEHI